jgi:hypothetical protein
MKRRIAACLTALLWAFFTYLGYHLTQGVAQRHVPGYPNAGQWHYYVHFPLAMFLLSVGLMLLAKRLLLPLFIGLWVLQLIVFIPFFLGYTGGV